MNSDDFARSLAVDSLTSILISLVCILLAWFSLQQFRFDLFLKQPKSFPAKLLQIMLAITIGYIVGQFMSQYLNWSSNLQGFF